MRDLADYYTTYDPDVKPDFVAANRWLKMAADRGDVVSIHNLGHAYDVGLGVPVDKAEAARLFMQSSKMGLAASQNNLGWAYYTGAGVPKSLPDAVYWIAMAAEQGEPFAYGSLCEISGATDLFKTDPAEALMWCGLAIEHLPDGDAKEAAKAVYFPLIRSMSHADYAAGDRAIKEWNSANVTDANMRNVGDDLN
jgi:TPR repeat protein